MLDRTALNEAGVYREYSHSHDGLRLGVNPTMRVTNGVDDFPKSLTYHRTQENMGVDG